MVLAATQNLASSGLIRRCSTATIDNDIMALMLCPSVLSAPILIGHFYTSKAILQPPHTMRTRVDVVLAATQNLASSGLIQRCSTATIDNDIMALMLCPSALSAPTLMGYLYAYNSILRAPTKLRRVDNVLAAIPNQQSSGHLQHCSTVAIDNESMAFMLCPSALSVTTLVGHYYSLNAL